MTPERFNESPGYVERIQELHWAAEIVAKTALGCWQDLVEDTREANDEVHQAFVNYVETVRPHVPNAILVEDTRGAATVTTVSGEPYSTSAAVLTYFLTDSMEIARIRLTPEISPDQPSDIDPRSDNFVGFQGIRDNGKAMFTKIEPSSSPSMMLEDWQTTEHENSLFKKLECAIRPAVSEKERVQQAMQKFREKQQELQETAEAAKNIHGRHMRPHLTRLANLIGVSKPLPIDPPESPSKHVYIPRNATLVVAQQKKQRITGRPKYDMKSAIETPPSALLDREGSIVLALMGGAVKGGYRALEDEHARLSTLTQG